MDTPIRLIAGLGNPGAQYERTRHNAGFCLIERIAQAMHADFALEKSFFGHLAKARVSGELIYLLKPLTFMNRSGQAVGALARFYKLPVSAILVLHDELDLAPGQVKLKYGGGHAGHNGLKDIQAALGSADFWRLRLGIGHPRTLGLAQAVVDFVLNRPRPDEESAMASALARCEAVLPDLLAGQFAAVSQHLHSSNP